MGYGNFRGAGGSSGGFGRSRGGFRGGGFRRPFGPREMTKIKCAECGKEDEVPFKPRDNSTVLCKECYMKKKGIEPRSSMPMQEQAHEKAPAKEADDSEDEFDEESEESGTESEEETF